MWTWGGMRSQLADRSSQIGAPWAGPSICWVETGPGHYSHLGDGSRFAGVATLFAVERATGIEPTLSAWEW
jgi:hypothetical protein